MSYKELVFSLESSKEDAHTCEVNSNLKSGYFENHFTENWLDIECTIFSLVYVLVLYPDMIFTLQLEFLGACEIHFNGLIKAPLLSIESCNFNPSCKAIR